ncbi:NAD(P)H-binding protein [Nitratireductor aquibiodomus]|uniref:NAD(P)-dependent oxidoreductase n=1 Tax=Nitratireductor aquibiodomus TaxID=204799 RepID=UPI00192BD49E
MRILVFGASGNVGRRVVAEALQRGHEVTAVVRDPDRARRSLENATIVVGNAAAPQDVARLSADQDVVVSATRPKLGSEHEHPSTAESLLKGLRLTRHTAHSGWRRRQPQRTGHGRHDCR